MDLTIDEKTQMLIREYMPGRDTLRSLSEFFSTLSDSTRIRILSALSICPMSVTDITKMLNLNQTTVSHQLKNLRDMNMVDFNREGRMLKYYILQPKILDVLLNVVEIL